MDFQEFNKLLPPEKNNLLEKWKSSSNIDNLIMSLEDSNYEISGKASEYLVEIGKPSVNRLVNASVSKNIDVRSWAVVTLGQIENIGVKPFYVLVRIALKDPNLIVRNKAYHAILDSLQFTFKQVKRIFELTFYYIFISIVQMVCLIFLIAPIIILIGKYIPFEYKNYRDLISFLILASAVPVASGFVATYLFKNKEANYPLAALLGVLQIIPYNFLLAFLVQNVNIINTFVPIFGLIGGIFGQRFYLAELERREMEISEFGQTYVEYSEAQKTILFLIFQRLKLSKKLQDRVIFISSVIGILLLVFISVSLYNVSSISTNKKLFDIKHYQETFPYSKSYQENF